MPNMRAGCMSAITSPQTQHIARVLYTSAPRGGAIGPSSRAPPLTPGGLAHYCTQPRSAAPEHADIAIHSVYTMCFEVGVSKRDNMLWLHSVDAMMAQLTWSWLSLGHALHACRTCHGHSEARVSLPVPFTQHARAA
jgi:hypothetical protein